MCSNASAQTIRGVVRDSVLQNPLDAATVFVLSQEATVLAQVRTLQDGTFDIALPAGAVASRLRVVRLGYAPRNIEVGGRTVFNVLLARLLPVLDTVRVSRRPVCRPGDNSAEAQALWNQLHSEFIAGLATSLPPSDTVHLARVERTPHPDRLQLIAFSTALTQLQAFEKARAGLERFLRGSFPADTAPPMNSLLGDSFLARHCVRLLAGQKTQAGEEGLEFEPVAGHDRSLDVAGHWWRSQAGGSLRSLEFRYVNTSIPGIKTFRGWLAYAVGRADFAIDADWWLYGEPTSGTAHAWASGAHGPITEDAPAPWEEWGQAVESLNSPPAVRGRVVRNSDSRPAPGVVIGIARVGESGSPPKATEATVQKVTVTDSAGWFRFPNLTNAWYVVGVVDSTMVLPSTGRPSVKFRLRANDNIFLEVNTYEGSPLLSGTSREGAQREGVLFPFPPDHARLLLLVLDSAGAVGGPTRPHSVDRAKDDMK